jgi:hypothetical protein
LSRRSGLLTAPLTNPRRRVSAPLLVLALAGLLAGCGSSSSSPGKLPPKLKHRPSLESIFSPGPELINDTSSTLDQLHRLGVDRVHVYLHWTDVAPSPQSTVRPEFDAADPAAYSAAGWAPFDTIVRGVQARGMGVDMALVPPPPRWASGKGAPDPATQTEWRPSAPEFGQFVRAVATRYSGTYIPSGESTPLPRVNFWSIWNEPNLGVELAPQAHEPSQVEVSGQLYRGLLDAAWSALQDTGHGHDTILIGEIAPAGATFGNAPGNFAAMAPLRFLRALYCVDRSYQPLVGQAAALRGCPTDSAGSKRFAAEHPAMFQATAFADHPYPQGLPPNTATPNEPDYAELAEVPHLAQVLDKLQGVYGSSKRFPIYSTEFGYQTTPPDPGVGTVSPARAALYLNWSEYLTWRDPRLRSYDQYLLVDPQGNFFASGLLKPDGTPKPAYAAYRLPVWLPVTSTSQGSPLEVWGCARPARYLGPAARRVTIQFAPAGSASFRTVQTVHLHGQSCYFDVLQKFAGSGTVRLRWQAPGGSAIFSRTTGVTLR